MGQFNVTFICSIGDTVYIIPSEANVRVNICNNYDFLNKIHTQIVSKILVCEKDIIYHTKPKDSEMICSCLGSAFGQDWFVDRKKAENVLNERIKKYKMWEGHY